MEHMEEQLLISCMETDRSNDGSTRSKVSTLLMLKKFNGERADINNPDMYEDVLMRSILSAKLDIKAGRNAFQMDYVFPSSVHADLRMMWNALEEYGRLSSVTNKEDYWRYQLLLHLTPDEYAGQYAISMVNPIFWSLMPSVVGGSLINAIRIVFIPKTIQFSEIRSDEGDGNEN